MNCPERLPPTGHRPPTGLPSPEPEHAQRSGLREIHGCTGRKPVAKDELGVDKARMGWRSLRRGVDKGQTLVEQPAWPAEKPPRALDKAKMEVDKDIRSALASLLVRWAVAAGHVRVASAPPSSAEQSNAVA